MFRTVQDFLGQLVIAAGGDPTKLLTSGGTFVDMPAGSGPHTHVVNDVTGLQAALDAKAGSAHAHVVADVTGLQGSLDAKAPASHTHVAAEVVGLATVATSGSAADLTGTLAPARIADGSLPLTKLATIPGGPATCRKAADQTFNSATPANVTDLSFPVVAGRYYTFRFLVLHQSNTQTVGLGVSVTYPSATRFGATVSHVIAADGAGAGLQGAITASDDPVLGTSVPAINVDYVSVVEGVILPSASGTLQLRARTETGTTNVVVRQGSCGVMYDLGV